jgi:hypothetical protein
MDYTTRELDPESLSENAAMEWEYGAGYDGPRHEPRQQNRGCECQSCRHAETLPNQRWNNYGEELEYEAGVNHFTCANDQLAQLSAVLGTPVTVAALRRGLATAVRLAIKRARAAAAQLRKSPRSAGVERIFRDAFGVRTGFVPSWRSSNSKWADLGELVAIRLESAAKNLADGSMRYFCWDYTQAVCGAPGPTTYRAATLSGQSQMCIGQQFWQWWVGRNFESMAAVLIHEHLHDYFARFGQFMGVIHGSRTSGQGGPLRFRNANCYVLFTMRLAGKPLTGCLRERCHDLNTAACPRVTN